VDEKREWVIKTTYQDGSIDYSDITYTKGDAEAWKRINDRAWPMFTHEVVHVSEREGGA
jgi:hypothetical protein